MPSVTDIQQQQQQSPAVSNIHGKATPPPQATTTVDATNADPLTQAILVLEKKQRNLGKRKEKLEGYQQEEKSGKELHKDQKEALAKYPEVLGQIECVKELSEQFKKIQTDSAKNQKRLLKQATEEKRQLVSQRLREYARLRYLLDHRPTTLKPEESTLLDELSAVINPTDNSLNSISRSIDTVLSIYQGGSSTTSVKHLPGKNVQEVRETIENLLQTSEPQVSSSSSVTAPAQVETKESDETNLTNTNANDIHSATNNNFNEYPFQLDTRTQDVSVEQIIQNSQFLSNDLTNPSQDNDDDQIHDSKQYSQPSTGIELNQRNSSSPSSIDNQQHQQQYQQDHITNLGDSNDQQGDEQWQHQRGNNQRGGQFSNGGGNRGYHRGRSNNYHQQWRGQRGGYDNAYSGGGGNPRPHYDNNRGRGGPNQNYRGNRGGNYRGGNRGYNNNNGNGYQKPAQYQQNNNQPQQVRSAPPSSTQQPQQQ